MFGHLTRISAALTLAMNGAGVDTSMLGRLIGKDDNWIEGIAGGAFDLSLEQIVEIEDALGSEILRTL